MPSTYAPLLRAELIANGEQAGSWGTTTNSNLSNILETAIAGSATITLPAGSADYTLTALNGLADEARVAVLKITGALTADRNVICPSSSKEYIVYNGTSGSYRVTVKTAAGTGVVIPQGGAGYAHIYCNGTNVVRVAADVPVVSTAQRDPNPLFGRLQVNSDLGQVEWWNGSAWTPAGGGATGGGTDTWAVEVDQVVTKDWTVGLGAYASGMTFTNGSTTIGMTGHSFVVGSKVHFATTGVLPTNFAIDTVYYVLSVVAGVSFTAATSLAGPAISAGSAGSGTHSVAKLKNAITGASLDIANGVTVTIPSGTYLTLSS